MAKLVFEKPALAPVEKTVIETEVYALSDIDIHTSLDGSETPSIWVRIKKGTKTVTQIEGQDDVEECVWDEGSNHCQQGQDLLLLLLNNESFAAAWEQLTASVETHARNEGWLPTEAT